MSTKNRRIVALTAAAATAVLAVLGTTAAPASALGPSSKLVDPAR